MTILSVHTHSYMKTNIQTGYTVVSSLAPNWMLSKKKGIVQNVCTKIYLYGLNQGNVSVFVRHWVAQQNRKMSSCLPMLLLLRKHIAHVLKSGLFYQLIG